MTTETKQGVELNCREAQLILRVMDPNSETNGGTPEEAAACRHYSGCVACKKIGLSKIIGKELTCQETLEILARNPGPHYLRGGSSIREQLAIEHVFGRRIEGKSEIYGACEKPSCMRLFHYWLDAPLSCFYDGEEELAREIPLLIEIFVKEGWPLNKLLEIQQQRLMTLVNSLVKGEKPSGYHPPEDVVNEIKENIQVLQELLSKIPLETMKGLF
jgi:hypothetical protein